MQIAYNYRSIGVLKVKKASTFLVTVQMLFIISLVSSCIEGNIINIPETQQNLITFSYHIKILDTVFQALSEIEYDNRLQLSSQNLFKSRYQNPFTF